MESNDSTLHDSSTGITAKISLHQKTLNLCPAARKTNYAGGHFIIGFAFVLRGVRFMISRCQSILICFNYCEMYRMIFLSIMLVIRQAIIFKLVDLFVHSFHPFYIFLYCMHKNKNSMLKLFNSLLYNAFNYYMLTFYRSNKLHKPYTVWPLYTLSASCLYAFTVIQNVHVL